MSASRVVAIVQARFGSTRLPGKVLERLGAGTVLSEVLDRCRAIRSVTTVCCAVADRPEDDPVAAEAARAGAVVVRGSATDVLDRYARAAQETSADEILRVTSDCPLIDPEICDQVIRLRRAESADYAANNSPPGFPHGLDCEAMTRSSLDRAATHATAPDEREHVTPWLRRHDGLRKAWLKGPGGPAAAQRWTLDYPADLDFIRAVFARLPMDRTRAAWRTALRIVEETPALAAINAAHRDEKRLVGVEPQGAQGGTA